jgi:hypothetical protein
MRVIILMRMRCGMGGDMGGKCIQGFGGETRRKETAMKTNAQNNTLQQLVDMANDCHCPDRYVQVRL